MENLLDRDVAFLALIRALHDEWLVFDELHWVYQTPTDGLFEVQLPTQASPLPFVDDGELIGLRTVDCLADMGLLITADQLEACWIARSGRSAEKRAFPLSAEGFAAWTAWLSDLERLQAH